MLQPDNREARALPVEMFNMTARIITQSTCRQEESLRRRCVVHENIAKRTDNIDKMELLHVIVRSVFVTIT